MLRYKLTETTQARTSEISEKCSKKAARLLLFTFKMSSASLMLKWITLPTL